MPRAVEVRALPGFRLWVRYSDGVAGEVDLSHLAGRGVFALWDEPGAFERVHLGESGEIAWDDAVDICPDSVYMRITGKTPQQMFPSLIAADISSSSGV
jgi:hypothetical protein